MDGQFFPGQAIQFEGGFVRPPWYQRSAQFLIDKMGLGTNLIYTLDPGEVTSYDPDTDDQAVLDLSGNGNHFQLGATSGSEASDPIFAGTKGALSKAEYFALDGASYLYKTTPPAAIEAFHKDGAVGTIAGWWRYVADAATGQIICGSMLGGSTSLGMRLFISGGGVLRFFQGNGAGAGLNQNSSIDMDAAAGDGNWAFIAAAFDEGANSCRWRVNDTVNPNSTLTFVSPSASDAGAWGIGAGRSAGAPMLDGSAIGPQWAWSRQLSAEEIEHLYVASRVRGWLS